MTGDFTTFSPGDIPIGRMYDLLACAIQPRPIAFVSTISRDGALNLAPFSFFAAGGANPPSLVYCPALNRLGEPKDSLRNVEETGEFVVNAVVRRMADAMNLTGVDYPHGVDEFEVAAFTAMPSVTVRPPRVGESPVHFECRVLQVLRLGSGANGTVYVIGEITHVHVRGDHWREGEFQASDFRMVGRLGGAEYVDVATPEVFEMVRPRLN